MDAMSTDCASQFQDGGRLAGQADVAIVVDSACCLTPDLIRRWNITLVPHELIIDGRSYRDGVDISPGEFYTMLRDSRVVPTTAAPRPQEFLDGMLAAGELASVRARLGTIPYLSLNASNNCLACPVA